MINHQLPLVKKAFLVDRHEIAYLRFTLESYQGMAFVTTINPETGLIQVSMPPTCEKTVLELVEALRQEGLRLEIHESELI